MSTRRPKHRYTAAERAAHVKSWQNSGMTRRAFAEKVGVCDKTLCNWIRRHAAKSNSSNNCDQPQSLSLLPVRSVMSEQLAQSSHNHSVELMLPSGIRLRMSHMNHIPQLVSLIKELERCN